MSINTDNLKRCIETLEKSYSLIKTSEENSVYYEIYRNSLVKSFEMCLEQAGKLLKKRLMPFFATKTALDKLTFKEIFRHALKYSLISEEETLHWFEYRDNRNDTAHDYGVEFAKTTLLLMDNFIKDVNNLRIVIEGE